jgi:tRNA(Leu) C34 or U34 (ribose-2'-O)-methylase TrmL
MRMTFTGGSSWEARIAAKARAICDADPVAPPPDAPIIIGNRRAFAWEARTREATALEAALHRQDGYAALALWRPKCPENVGTILRSAMCFGVAAIFLCGGDLRFGQAGLKRLPTDTMKAWRHIPLIVSAMAPELIGAECVAVELTEDAANLKDFEHPESAIYLFGPEDASLPNEVVSLCRHRVAIPSKRCLNLGVAASIVLYDRVVKRWKVPGECGTLPGECG